MTKALYAGSFDPFTMGHLDILRRSALLFEEVLIAVLNNPNKTCAFSVDERCGMINSVIASEKMTNVQVNSFSGLTVELARREGCSCILRGVRDSGDFSFEQRLEAMNAHLAPEIQTVYLAASPRYACISSSGIKELCAFGGTINGLVPAPIQISIAERLYKR